MRAEAFTAWLAETTEPGEKMRAWLMHIGAKRRMASDDPHSSWQDKGETNMTKTRTKDNTKFDLWWSFAKIAFANLGLQVPEYRPAHDAYEMGESPETWAEYVRHDWPKVPGAE